MSRRAFDPRMLAVTAVMTAIVFVLTSMVRVPTPARGYIHLGDAGVFFSALAFGPWIGAVAGGLGTFLADVAGGFPQWAVFSLLIHGLQGWVVGWTSQKWRGVGGILLSTVLGGVIVVVGYFVAGVILAGVGAAVGELPMNVIQVAGGAVVGVPLFLAVRQAYPPIARLGRRDSSVPRKVIADYLPHEAPSVPSVAPKEDSRPLANGQVLQNRYQIESLLGRGGMGAVYRAIDLRFGAPVAVKENLEISPEAQKQFTHEADILYRLHHPNLPRVTDHFIVSGKGQYLVMDFVQGQNLNQILSSGPVPEAQALMWMHQVLDALVYLHNQTPPIIHRDIKPANIKITPQGHLFLVDFGLAKVDPILRTTTGARGVTPGFAPPEQYGQGRTDARSDLYAVGATLYALLTGTVPPDSVDLMTGNSQLIPPSRLNPQISPGVEAAVLRALEMDPGRRFATAEDLRQALL